MDLASVEDHVADAWRCQPFHCLGRSLEVKIGNESEKAAGALGDCIEHAIIAASRCLAEVVPTVIGNNEKRDAQKKIARIAAQRVAEFVLSAAKKGP
jgi:hypothetical protein